MAQIKKDTSLRKAILQAAITGQLISDIGGESDVLFSNEKKSKTKLINFLTEIFSYFISENLTPTLLPWYNKNRN